MKLNVNGSVRELDAEPDMPLLWALREQLGLTGTKYGCGVAQCGACTVHLNGQKNATNAVQKAWVELDVPQCGYCQSGQIMAAAALLQRIPKPTDADIDQAMSNICRCGTYQRIRDGIHVASGQRKLADVLAAYDDLKPTLA